MNNPNTVNFELLFVDAPRLNLFLSENHFRADPLNFRSGMSRLFDGTKQGKLHREHSEFLSHTSTPMRIEAIQFSLLSERDVTRLSEVELTQKLLYSPDDRTLPAENGPLDRRLGVSARNALCATCGATLADCAGHFGRIELCLPVFHVGYFNAVKSLLERICKCCSRILLSETERSQLLANVNSADAHLRAAARRDAHKLAKRSKWRCHWCAAYNGPVKKVTGMLKLLHERFAKPNKAAEHAIANRDVDFVAGGKFELSTLPPFVEFSEAVANHSELSLLVHKAAEDLNPLHVHQLLSRIEDDDCLLLGLNPAKARPELLMLTSLIVPPVCLRPSLSRDPSSGTTEDDLTVQLSSIIHYNELIKKQLNLVHGATTREALIAGATSGGAATMAAVAAAAAAAASGAAMAVAAVSSSSSSSLLAAPGGGMGGAGSADAVAAAAKAPSLATVQGQWSHLQCIVAQYINSDMPGVSKATFSSTTYRRSLCQRLKGKQGRFRGNLSGKRVDFSGRTVISPDPNLHVEEVGIPTDVAKIMTYPERVFNKNIDYLRELVRRGADEWPGATHVRNEQGDRALRFADRERTAQHLKPGDIVMRHMRHGDILLFNRQPSLHRVSIMAFKARVMAGRTFRFNECACVSFNADFDGDEMNIHLPQTEEARAESRELMSVVCNLVTPRTGDILVAATQDFLSCSFLLSKRDRFFTRAQIMQLCWHMMGVEGARDAAVAVHLPQPTILRPKQLWTGKQMIELILCPTRADRARVSINLFAKTKMMTKRPAGDTAPWMCARDGCLIIRDSQLLSGWLEKSVLGSSGQKNNLFHALLRDVDAAAAALCMTRLARLCARTIGEFGFTFGIEDVTASPALLAEKAALIKSGYAHCDTIIRQYRENRLDAQPGCSIEETLESKLTGELGSLRQRAGELCILALPAHNAPLIMSQCGSKGSLINISQMIAIVGQQQVGGARIQDGFERRTLPHFARNSREPAAKGFVANSFQSGLTPTEFFFHTMGGREGLVDTAVKTAETGYLQRKMMKSLEDLSVQYDGSVRTSSGNVVQFEYGDDQLDPLCMEQAQNPVDFERQMSRIVAANVNREPNLRPHALQRLAAGWLQWHLQKERNTSSPLFARQVLQYLCGLPPGPGDASAAENEPYLYAKPGAPPSLLAQLISLRKSLGLPETKAYAMEELHTALGWRVIFAKGATRDDVKHEADKIEALAMAAAGRVEQSHDALDVDRPDNAPVVSPARLDPQLVAACAVDATKEARIRVYASDFDGDECDAVSVRLLAKLVRITAAQLMTFINVVVKKHQLARIEPGSAVGALAAQSIGEPATQMTLKTCEHGRLARISLFSSCCLTALSFFSSFFPRSVSTLPVWRR